MPTNVSTPIWRCDVCGTTHGGRLDLAERCEAAPVPPLLPEGTPVLGVRKDEDRRDRFVLLPLTPVNGRMRTTVTAYRTEGPHSHHRTYTFPGLGGRATLDDETLSPGLPGHLQVQAGPGFLHVEGSQGERLDRVAVAAALGLGQPGSAAARGEWVEAPDWNTTATWVGPITAEVRAVYDLLKARIRPLNQAWSSHHLDQERLNYAVGVCRGDLAAASAMLSSVDPAHLDAEISDLWARWWAGEQVSVPLPSLEASSPLTPSKVTRAVRPVIEATGVVWEPRTDASEYVRHLTRRALMTTAEKSFTRAFGRTRLVAVGGVKGGVGKTTVAAALAQALARAGQRVLLVDLDLDAPNLHLTFDLPPQIAVSPDLTRLVGHLVAPNLRVLSHGQIGHGPLPDRWSQAAAVDWVRFLGSTADVSDTDIVILDLPAGQGAVAEQVLGSHSFARADVLVSVTSPDAYALADARTGLRLHMHEQRERIVVENLGRVSGTTADGSVVEVRPYGPSGAVESLATETGATFGGSLPYGPLDTLAVSPEMAALAALVIEGVPRGRG